MMNKMKSILRGLFAAGLFFTAAGSTAEAGPIVRYEFSTLSPLGSFGMFTGFVEFDSDLRVALGQIQESQFSDWGFDWGSTFSYGPSTHSFAPGFFGIKLDASLLVAIGTTMCFSTDGGCAAGTGHPVALVGFNSVNASTGPGICCTGGTGTWGEGELLVAAPEPATLAILGVGLAGLGVVRRRRIAA